MFWDEKPRPSAQLNLGMNIQRLPVSKIHTDCSATNSTVY